MTHKNALQNLNDEEAARQFPLSVLLFLVGFFGAIGNSVVIYIYTRVYTNSNSRCFIRWLASVDLMTCVVAIPVEIFTVQNQYEFKHANICKVSRFMNSVGTITSATLLVLIAIDRYRKICRPCDWQIGNQSAKTLCLMVFLFGCLFSTPNIFLYGIKTTPLLIQDNLYNGTECSTDDNFTGAKGVLVYSIISVVLFVAAVIILIIMYFLIGRKVRFFAMKREQRLSTSVELDGVDDCTPKNDILKNRINKLKSDFVSNRFKCNVRKGNKSLKSEDIHHVCHVVEQTKNSSDCSDNILDAPEKEESVKKFHCEETSKCYAGIDTSNSSIQVNPGEVLSPHANREDTLLNDNNLLFKNSSNSDESVRPNLEQSVIQKEINICQSNIHEESTVVHMLQLNPPETPAEQDAHSMTHSGRLSESSDKSKKESYVDTVFETTESAARDSFEKTAEPSRQAASIPGSGTTDESDKDTKTGNSKIKEQVDNGRDSQERKTQFLHEVVVEETNTPLHRLTRIRSIKVQVCRMVSFKKHHRVTAKPIVSPKRLAKNTTFLMFLITLVFLMTFCPYLILIVLREIITDFIESMSDEGRTAYRVFLRSYFFNSAINPFIYSTFDRRFRKACKTTLSSIKDKVQKSKRHTTDRKLSRS